MHFNDFSTLDKLRDSGDEPSITLMISDWLIDWGYTTGFSDIGEIVVEYLCDEIGPKSFAYVARRYRMSEESARSLLRDLEQFARYQDA